MPERGKPRIILRPFEEKDCRQVWEWRNEASVRQASFQSESIPYPDHERWFMGKLADPDFRGFIAEDAGGGSVGYVRFQRHGRDAEISVALAPQARGNGYGTALIREASERMMKTGVAERVIALVRGDNPASLAVFCRAGFKEIGRKTIGPLEGHVLAFGSAGS